ncbi:anti-sigma factor [Paenibacillus sp. MBLB2552]|uniref:Anti-sigma factor n=1 Tax=Paenibacillus mellifer TaxID=2937794 RepID=A0A9X1XV24_9BACL|nr:anti-sigma factor [Paenibacillus mellifer]MCK8485879.1 anti-sigma factor [Paenibacillus mellifer]
MNGQAGDNIRNIGSAEHESVCLRMYSEQEWIDWLLGTLTEAKHSEMAKHLDTCKFCLGQKTYWQDVLGLAGADASELDMPGKPTAGEPDLSQVMSAEGPNSPEHATTPSMPRHDSWADAVPSERIRRSLRRRVRVIGWRRRALRLLTVRWKWTVSMAAALMLLVGMGYALDHLNQPEAGWGHYVQTYEPEALPVLSKPDTISYPIAMGRLEPENGRVWYNAASREMLMLVGGLVPDKGQTIRVWIVKEGARDSLGLLQYHANRAHLYVKDRTLNVDDDLELTIEPISGLQDMNKVPNSISLDLLGR